MNRKFIIRFRGVSSKNAAAVEAMVREFVDGMPARVSMDSATVEKGKA